MGIVASFYGPIKVSSVRLFATIVPLSARYGNVACYLFPPFIWFIVGLTDEVYTKGFV